MIAEIISIFPCVLWNSLKKRRRYALISQMEGNMEINVIYWDVWKFVLCSCKCFNKTGQDTLDSARGRGMHLVGNKFDEHSQILVQSHKDTHMLT